MTSSSFLLAADLRLWLSPLWHALLLPGLAWWMAFVLPVLAVGVGTAMGKLWNKRLYQPRLLSSLLLAYALILAGMLAMPPSLLGKPDGNCEYYRNGDAIFVLEGIYKTQVKASGGNVGPEQYVFMVRSFELFGDDVHTCAVKAAGASKILDQLVAIYERMKEMPKGDGYNKGKLKFSFNEGILENPNVLLPPGQHRGEKGMPDPATRKYDM